MWNCWSLYCECNKITRWVPENSIWPKDIQQLIYNLCVFIFSSFAQTKSSWLIYHFMFHSKFHLIFVFRFNLTLWVETLRSEFSIKWNVQYHSNGKFEIRFLQIDGCPFIKFLDKIFTHFIFKSSNYSLTRGSEIKKKKMSSNFLKWFKKREKIYRFALI